MNDQPEQEPEDSPASEEEPLRRAIPALSVQATAIIRAIDALGTISWWSLGGMALTLLFSGLIRLQRDVTMESVFIGEYQVPTEFLPHFGVAFGIFIQWMLSTRVLHVCRVFESSTLPVNVMRDMVRLNPPMINLFEPSGAGRLMSGLGVFVAVWAIFYGNLVGLMMFLSVGRVTTLGVTDGAGLMTFVGFLALNVYFALRHLRPALVGLHHLVHSETIKFGLRRSIMGAFLFLIAGAYQVEPLVTDITDQDNGLLGPVVANAVDGDTLFVNGWQVDLFGVDAVESSQTCLLESGERFPCGEEATAHLQALIQDTQILCWPLVSTGDRSAMAYCVLDEGQELPTEGGRAFHVPTQRPHSLSRRMVRDGYAVPMGVGPEDLASELEAAQSERRGVWRASVEPPWAYRRRGGN